MKTFRLWLLVVLAVLLPMRGALAAGMLCPVGGFGVQAEVQLTQHTHGHEASAAGHEHQHQEAHDHGVGHDRTASGTPDEAGSAADKCNLCSAFCSVTGLVSAGVAIAAPQSVFAVFPDLYAPAASFVSDGQERPPRTI